MRASLLWLSCALLAVCPGASRAQTPAATLDLLRLDGKGRLRIEIVGAGEPARWHTFLERWFAYFDTDEDGILTRKEAARVFSLPLPDGSVSFDFAKADANQDGKITQDEWKAYYRSAGFAPVLAIVAPVAIDHLRVADALFRHLGPDAGGKLPLVRFERASELLRNLDENEDEVLTDAEVLSLAGNAARKLVPKREFKLADAEDQPTTGTIRLHLTDGKPSPGLRVEWAGKGQPRTSVDDCRLLSEDAVYVFSRQLANTARAVAHSRQFVLAQFRSVAGKGGSITKLQVQDDPSLQLLADLFPHADRNQDGVLTLAELDRLIEVIEVGVTCQLSVTLTDNGRNLFCHLDANQDGRLDALELRSAARRITALGGAKGLTRDQVPHYVQVELRSGFAVSAFGPLPLSTPAAASPAPGAKRLSRGPAWFQAMDRNGDGFVSAREFLGPAALFQKLDRNGDGLISVEEAERAEALQKTNPAQK